MLFCISRVSQKRMSTHATSPLWSAATPDERMEKLRVLVMDLYRSQHGDALAKVIADLERHPCADESEAQSVRTIIELARANPNILWSNCEAGHITGSALIVDAPRRRVLLNHHKKFDRWMQFGGHPDFETEPWRVALREAREETGLVDLAFVLPDEPPRPFDVDAHVIQARGERPQHMHLDLRYLLATGSPELARATHESNAIQWFEIDDALAMPLEPNVLRMMRKAKNL